MRFPFLGSKLMLFSDCLMSQATEFMDFTNKSKSCLEQRFLPPSKALTLSTCCPLSISILSLRLSHHTLFLHTHWILISHSFHLFPSLCTPFDFELSSVTGFFAASVHSPHRVLQLWLCSAHESSFQLTSVSAWCLSTQSHFAPWHYRGLQLSSEGSWHTISLLINNQDTLWHQLFIMNEIQLWSP